MKLKNYICFVIGNWAVVSLSLFAFGAWSGFRAAIEMVPMMIPVALPVILFSYPLLVKFKNWFFRTLIFYLSMVLFLFLVGVILNWGEKAGSYEAGTLLASLDAGIRTVIFGHLLLIGNGLIFLFPIIILFNFLLRKPFSFP